MTTLAAFGNLLGVRRVPLPNGSTVELHALSAAEEGLVTVAWPAPRAPEKHDPTKGSKARPIPDMLDPTFLAKEEAWYEEHKLLCVAVGMRYQTGSGASFSVEGKDAERTAWCREALAELRAAVPPPVVAVLYGALAEMSLGELVARAGEGNSGAGVEEGA